MPAKITQLSETSVRIGKAGLTDSVLAQIRTVLKRKKVIKIKFFATAVGDHKKELFSKLENMVPCKIVHKVGFVAIIERLGR